MAAQNPGVPPPMSGSAAPSPPGSADEPDGWGKWGGAGIIKNFNPSVLGANRGHDQGAATPPPGNGADMTERVSTGGGPPGARVRRQHGQEYTQQRSRVLDYGETPGREPDDDLWGRLVHPLQLDCISQSSWEVINLLHLDIKGEFWGEVGMQQQQGILQETWGESRWEEIVCGSRQGGGDPVTPPNRRWTHQELYQHGEQWAGQYQNKTTPSMLVRRNLASYTQGELLCWAELIPTKAQIRAATILDVRTSTSTTTEGEGFCATA